MLGGYISVLVFVIGMFSLVGAAMLLSLQTRHINSRSKRVVVSYLTASILAFVTWQAITWTGFYWWIIAPLFYGTVLVQALFFGWKSVNLGAKLASFIGVLILSALSSFMLGRTALEIGITNKQPVTSRSATTIEFIIEYQGQDYPASVTKTSESVIELHTRRGSWLPTLVWPSRSLQYKYPKIESNLPFELYFDGAESTRLQRIRKGSSWVNSFPRSITQIDLVSCSSNTCERVHTSAEPVGATVNRQFNPLVKTQVVTHSEAYAFNATLAESAGQPQEIQFMFRNPNGRRLNETIVDADTKGNVWLLTSWGKFPASHKEKCNNIGYLSYWNLCTISEATWDQIRSNQRVYASTEN